MRKPRVKILGFFSETQISKAKRIEIWWLNYSAEKRDLTIPISKHSSQISKAEGAQEFVGWNYPSENWIFIMMISNHFPQIL